MKKVIAENVLLTAATKKGISFKQQLIPKIILGTADYCRITKYFENEKQKFYRLNPK